MSYSKRNRISAYQMHSHHTKSNRHNQSYSSDESHDNHSEKRGKHSVHLKREKSSSGSRDLHRRRERSYDSDEEVLKGFIPRSSSLSKDHSSEKLRVQEYLPRKESVGSRHEEVNKRHSAQSLMDIDFSTSHSGISNKSGFTRWKDASSRHGYSSEEESGGHLDDWKNGRKFSRYSDSEDDGDGWNSTSKSRRAWKNSSTQQSSYSSRTGDKMEKSNNSMRKTVFKNNYPKPLLETYCPPPVKKPVSLLDLPETSRSAAKFHRKATYRSNISASKKKLSNRASSSGGKSESNAKVSPSSRKRLAADADQGQSVKKAKVSRPKGSAKDKVAVVDTSRIIACKSNGQTFLVIPSFLINLYMHGRASVTVLMGSISILGWKLRTGSVYDVYSPASGCLLALQVGDGTRFKASEVKEELAKFSISENDRELEHVGNNTIAILKVDKLESAVCDYVTSFIPYTQLFAAAPSRDLEAHELKGITLPKLGLKVAPMKEMVTACMNTSQDYEEVLSKWTKKLSSTEQVNKPPIVLCCGAKNTGKSTFTRMLINASLKSVNAVAYLECDVGQTEFSPPATLSLHIIKQPILEPPFCHQRHAEKMVFYGETSPSYDPSYYVRCLEFIVEAYHEMNPQLPLIVNTMGFPEGVGVMLLVDTVHLVKPDLVIQIDSFSQAANLPPMTHEFVTTEEGWMYNKSPVLSIFAQLFLTLTPLSSTNDSQTSVQIYLGLWVPPILCPSTNSHRSKTRIHSL